MRGNARRVAGRGATGYIAVGPDEVQKVFPAGAITARQLFARPGIGGAVVLLRPDVPVWMDGRADFFGRDMLLLGYAYYGGTRDDPVPAGATCVIVDLGADATPGLRERLRTSPEWRLEGSEGSFELWRPSTG